MDINEKKLDYGNSLVGIDEICLQQ